MNTKMKPSASTSTRSRADTARNIRKQVGKTQAELADCLGVSIKAIQSYEQGWRKVPVRVMIQLLVLLGLYRKHGLDEVPCWELTGCPKETRNRCPSYTIGGGQFCWFIAAKMCRMDTVDDPEILPCMQCPVVLRLLKPGRTANVSA